MLQVASRGDTVSRICPRASPTPRSFPRFRDGLARLSHPFLSWHLGFPLPPNAAATRQLPRRVGQGEGPGDNPTRRLLWRVTGDRYGSACATARGQRGRGGSPPALPETATRREKTSLVSPPSRETRIPAKCPFLYCRRKSSSRNSAPARPPCRTLGSPVNSTGPLTCASFPVSTVL